MIRDRYFLCLLFLLFLTGCNQQLKTDMNQALLKTEEEFNGLNSIEKTASSFDGEDHVKFRIMVESHPTYEEAAELFNEVLEHIAKHANQPKLWEVFNANLDIKSYDDGVIYTATKLAKDELKIEAN